MKKVFLLLLTMALTVATAQAQDTNKKNFEYGVFKHLSVGASASTLGIGIDVATDVTKYIGLRAGVNIMPGVKFSTDMDANLDIPSMGSREYTIETKGSIGRTTVDVLVDFYPVGGFFITGGFSFGGARIVELTGHSDELKDAISQLPSGGNNAYIEIDKYKLPVDRNGDVKGEIKVNGFRPYFGIGFGSRAVPKHRVAFRMELGLQAHGTPKVMSDGNELDVLTELSESDDDFSKIVDKLKFYPVLKFRLCGRIF